MKTTKRLRKSRVRHELRNRMRGEGARVSPPPPAATRPAAKTGAVAVPRHDPFQYIRAELKQTGVVGGSIFLILIVLYFLLR